MKRTNGLKLLTIGWMVILAAGCSKEAFQRPELSSQVQSPGNFQIPAKVDILLAEDDTGSIFEAYEPISDQMPKLLEKLEATGWDYRYATTPLTTERPLDQVLASKFDGNWATNGRTSWKEPFPGADSSNPLGMVLSSVFRTENDYTHFIRLDQVGKTPGAFEPGFGVMRKALKTFAPQSDFIRPDAMLIIITVSNGNDLSLLNQCRRADNKWVSCDDATLVPKPPLCSSLATQAGNPYMLAEQNCRSDALSMNFYTNEFKSLKPHPDSLRFYAAVAASQQSGCLGSHSRAGKRYHRMAENIGGGQYDLCNQSVSEVLGSIAGNLNNIRKSFRIRYLILGQQPDLNSPITVTKNGSQNIPNDPVNGWTYEGFKTVFVIDDPIPMNQVTGYVIELHGSAKLVGDDYAEVDFKPFGEDSSG